MEMQDIKKCRNCDGTDFYANGGCKPCSRNKCKEYKLNNKKKISAYNKVYKSAHKLNTRAYNRVYFSNRKKVDPNYKMKATLRTRIYYALNGKKKHKKTFELLDCNYVQSKEWIESQFTADMNWGNHGTKWHIDHVIPCAKFNLTDISEQKKCFHWSNLRPYDGHDNIVRGDEITLTEFLDHQVIIKNYVTSHKEMHEIDFNILKYL
jgi:hypothetical protein